jgi:hypothetical protein
LEAWSPDRLEPLRHAEGGAPLVFDSEIVRLYVQPDSVEVEGTYSFICGAKVPALMNLFFPFPLDSLLGGARMVSLAYRCETDGWREAAFEESPSGDGAVWRLPLREGAGLEVCAVYRQALRAPYARYVVRTTRVWGRPLRHARFEIYLPSEARAPRFSYPFVPASGAASAFYLYEARNFWPEKDVVVEWEP